MIPTTTQPEFLTGADLCKRWSISRMTLWRMRERGKIKGYHIIAGSLRFKMSEIIKYESDSAA